MDRASKLTVFVVVCVTSALMVCSETPPPEESYYDREIAPSLTFTCAQQTTGCHLARDGQAAGNLDLTSYDSLMRRRDALAAYGPYPLGLFLMKVSPASEVASGQLDAPTLPEQRSVVVHADIRHAAGASVQVDSTVFNRLVGWINKGHTRNDAEPPPAARRLRLHAWRWGGAGTVVNADRRTPRPTRLSERRMAGARQCASSCHGARLATSHRVQRHRRRSAGTTSLAAAWARRWRAPSS